MLGRTGELSEDAPSWLTDWALCRQLDVTLPELHAMPAQQVHRWSAATAGYSQGRNDALESKTK